MSIYATTDSMTTATPPAGWGGLPHGSEQKS
jgi:hypothetical protein